MNETDYDTLRLGASSASGAVSRGKRQLALTAFPFRSFATADVRLLQVTPSCILFVEYISVHSLTSTWHLLPTKQQLPHLSCPSCGEKQNYVASGAPNHPLMAPKVSSITNIRATFFAICPVAGKSASPTPRRPIPPPLGPRDRIVTTSRCQASQNPTRV